MKVITYARGANGEHNVEAQQERLIKALPPEYEVVGSYCDVASGLSRRPPGLSAALDHLAAGGVQALCVTSLDRLTRRVDQLEALLRWCSQQGLIIKEFRDTPESQ